VFISLPQIIVLEEESVVSIPVVVHAHGSFIPVEEVAYSLNLALECRDAGLLNRNSTIQSSLKCLGRSVRTSGGTHVRDVLGGDAEQILPLLRHQGAAANVCRWTQKSREVPAGVVICAETR